MLRVTGGTKHARRGLHPMGQFSFEPIRVNAPGDECVLRTSDDVGAFVLMQVDAPRRKSPRWQAVRQDLAQARFGRDGLKSTALCAGHSRKRVGLQNSKSLSRGAVSRGPRMQKGAVAWQRRPKV